ncbi:uncharacterized protein H6S33_008925 [Morchella sextelata]|uniref:uncharacterized protein n=1 Tax=Morchella sextelata TaxID=1174677 RepID=UPI001D04DBA6|nr:uncharacterized protein H6S33_008925 [Morchella sextelata]KAH0612545.1 hypothetical protein H6S33_008925 [Morchella sextelata]
MMMTLAHVPQLKVVLGRGRGGGDLRIRRTLELASCPAGVWRTTGPSLPSAHQRPANHADAGMDWGSNLGPARQRVSHPTTTVIIVRPIIIISTIIITSRRLCYARAYTSVCNNKNNNTGDPEVAMHADLQCLLYNAPSPVGGRLGKGREARKRGWKGREGKGL